LKKEKGEESRDPSGFLTRQMAALNFPDIVDTPEAEILSAEFSRANHLHLEELFKNTF